MLLWRPVLWTYHGITKPEEHSIPTPRMLAAPRNPSCTVSRPAPAPSSRESLPPSLPPSASPREHRFPSPIWTRGGLLPAASSPTAGRAGTLIHRNGFAQWRLPAGVKRHWGATLFLSPPSRRSGAGPIEERGCRAGWVYGRSASRSACWCFLIRASCVPWQGTSGRAPISK